MCIINKKQKYKLSFNHHLLLLCSLSQFIFIFFTGIAEGLLNAQIQNYAWTLLLMLWILASQHNILYMLYSFLVPMPFPLYSTPAWNAAGTLASSVPCESTSSATWLSVLLLFFWSLIKYSCVISIRQDTKLLSTNIK